MFHPWHDVTPAVEDRELPHGFRAVMKIAQVSVFLIAGLISTGCAADRHVVVTTIDAESGAALPDTELYIVRLGGRFMQFASNCENREEKEWDGMVKHELTREDGKCEFCVSSAVFSLSISAEKKGYEESSRVDVPIQGRPDKRGRRDKPIEVVIELVTLPVEVDGL